MRLRRSIFSLPILFLFLASMLSACQDGPVDQELACNPQFAPVVKTLEAVQASSQIVYVSNEKDVYAFNAGNGKPVWCRAIIAGGQRDTFTGLTYAKGNLYAFTSAGTITAFNGKTGRLMWSNNVGSMAAATFISPSVIGSTIYGGRKSVYALNTQDGGVRWQYSFPNSPAEAFPLVASGGGVYFGTWQSGGPQQIEALDAATGETRWTSTLPEKELIFGRLIAGDGVVVFPYSKEDHFGLDVLSAQNGVHQWYRGVDLTSIGTAQTGAIANGFVYAIGAMPDNDIHGIMYLLALDVHTGAVRWSVPIGNETVYSSLFVANTTLYAAYKDGEKMVLDARNALTGQLLWHMPLQTGLLSQIVINQNHLFIGITSTTKPVVALLHAINLTTHKEDWEADISRDLGETRYIIVGGYQP